jgi:hypothetical protein
MKITHQHLKSITTWTKMYLKTPKKQFPYPHNHPFFLNLAETPSVESHSIIWMNTDMERPGTQL